MNRFALNAYLLVPIFVALFLFSGCATLPQDFDRPTSFAYTDTKDTASAKIRRDERLAHPGQSGFLLLGSGLDAFVVRVVLANAAERSIDAQYYLLQDDLIGALFVVHLLKAADRGVRVRLLVDDMDLGGRDLGAAVLDSHPNMEVRIFNPFSRDTGRLKQIVARFGSVTRRMHNKSFTVDNQASILGGRNIGNEYFEADPNLVFSDLDVLAIGPVAKEVSACFDKYWNSELAYPASVIKGEPPSAEEIKELRQRLNNVIAEQSNSVYLQALRNSNLANTIRGAHVLFHWGKGEVIYDQPEKILNDFKRREYHLAPKLKPYLEGTQKELIIFSPYFVPGEEGVAFLKQLRERGVRVRILTNSLASTDVALVHAGYAKYRKDLLRAGIELYEMNKKLTKKQRKEKKALHGSSKASLHAKAFIFDRKQVFIGSLNLDPRAILHNTEIGVIFASPEIANRMGDWFDQNIAEIAFKLELRKDERGAEQIFWYGVENGKQRFFEIEPHSGFWRRLGVSFMSLMPIESQL